MLNAFFVSPPKPRKFVCTSPAVNLMPDLSEYMTVDEAAEILKFHPETVRRLLRDEVLTGKKWRREWLALKKSVEEYQEKHGENKHNSRR